MFRANLYKHKSRINALNKRYGFCVFNMPRENYKHSEETKRKIGMAIKGRKLSEEHKKKISIARMEEKTIGTGKEELRQKIL